MLSNIAKITQWNEKRGFGFAEVNGKKYFVHKSALGPITRNPKVGDTIFQKLPKALALLQELQKESPCGMLFTKGERMFRGTIAKEN